MTYVILILTISSDWPDQAFKNEADHGVADEGDNGPGIALEVAKETPVAADPGKCSPHDPALV